MHVAVPTRMQLLLLLLLLSDANGFMPVTTTTTTTPSALPIPTTTTTTATTLFASSLQQQDMTDSLSSIIVIDNVADYCGVQPPADYGKLQKVLARWSWQQRNRVLKVLHWRDPLNTVDNCINLECLWWKALSTADPSSPCFEGQKYTQDMLPRASRFLVVNMLRRFHPRWIHALLELRVAYLNRAIESQARGKIRIISLGAGYDVRSVRLLNDDTLRVECFEFDLPSTVESKQVMFQQRLLKRQEQRRRRREARTSADGTLPLALPTLIGLDLNDIDQFKQELAKIFHADDNNDWHTIFVVEGVLMYLDQGKCAAVLEACADAAASQGRSASLCFADRLFDIMDCNLALVQEQLNQTGWMLCEWAPSPTANAKHMGIARLSPQRQTEKMD